MVWAEFDFGPERIQSRAEPEIDRDAILAAWPDEDDQPAPRYTVRLPGVPTELLVAAKHISTTWCGRCRSSAAGASRPANHCPDRRPG